VQRQIKRIQEKRKVSGNPPADLDPPDTEKRMPKEFPHSAHLVTNEKIGNFDLYKK
jgi:hypothetical protein